MVTKKIPATFELTKDGKRTGVSAVGHEWYEERADDLWFENVKGLVPDVDWSKVTTTKGGPGSGNFGHGGRPGKVGGSAPGKSGVAPKNGEVSESRAKVLPVSHDSGSKKDALNILLTGVGGQKRELPTGALVDGADPEMLEAVSNKSGVDKKKVTEIIDAWNVFEDEPLRWSSIQKSASSVFGLEMGSYMEDKWNFEKDNFSSGRYKNFYDKDHRQDTKNTLEAIYATTQDHLSKNGYSPDETITLFRVIDRGSKKSDLGKTPKGSKVTWQGSPLESWSSSLDFAKKFKKDYGGKGRIIACRVKAKNIFSTGRTGFGTLQEKEFVVMNKEALSGELVE